MYTKMAGGGITVDLIIPSDYMVGRLIEEDMLQELNFDNIPNYQYVDSRFHNPDFDPENKYSVPYSWGTVGIIYNTKYVDDADVVGWDLLWNEKYKGKILMFDNSRDAFCIAQCKLGYDINTTDPQELLHCAQELAQQRPVVQQYIMDQVFDLMENEEAWIAPYYAGDYLTMAGENENLAFYLPQDQGFNRFIDAMCIPTCCENKEAAETFINFLCDPEIAGGNMDWICYSTPIPAAKEYMELDAEMEEVNYAVEGGTGYLALPRETTRYMDSLFMRVRNGIDLEADGNGWLWVWILAAGVIALGFAAWLLLKKRKHKK
jgi:spermidine/putrescine transport system substrate-binding protein